MALVNKWSGQRGRSRGLARREPRSRSIEQGVPWGQKRWVANNNATGSVQSKKSRMDNQEPEGNPPNREKKKVMMLFPVSGCKPAFRPGAL